MGYNADLPPRRFVLAATKSVTKTDKAKDAYVLTAEQVAVLAAAGFHLTTTKPEPVVRIKIIGEPVTEVTASYYLSVRAGSGRTPEPRMGREFISRWLNVGDSVTLATDGRDLFAFRNEVRSEDVEPNSVYRPLRHTGVSTLHEMLPDSFGPPPRKATERSEFVRSPAVIELVLRRAAGRCEYPGCTQELFLTDTGDRYLEVHHIHWLSDGGADTPDNAAALCASCHRAMHHAKDREDRTRTLRASLDASLGPR